jgi:hypothetical protein
MEKFYTVEPLTTKELIVQYYLDYMTTNMRRPSRGDLVSAGYSRDMIRHHFGNMDYLEEYIEENYPDEVSNSIVAERSIFTKEMGEKVELAILQHQRFVVTTAVAGKAIHANFHKAIKNYCSLMDAQLLILPAGETLINKEWIFDPALADGGLFVPDDMFLNDNLVIMPLLQSSRMMNPIGGLDRLVQKEGSAIVGSPKQELIYTSTSIDPNSVPRARMSTGAITVADYASNRNLRTKQMVLANLDHVIGAIIVEVVDNKTFHFRQIHTDASGVFTDLGLVFGPDTETPTSVKDATVDVILGDYHCGWEDPLVEMATEDMLNTLKVRNVVLHDFFDGHSISHHDLGLPMKSAMKVALNQHVLLEEIKMGAHKINWFLDKIPGKLVMVCGNHDEFLPRYLERGGYVEDKVNHRFALDLAIEKFEGRNPLKAAYLSTGIIKEPDRIVWLDRDQSYPVAGVELGDHGDKGMNGSRGSMQAMEKTHRAAVVGHSHTAAILRGIYRVGTSTLLRMDYNRGPSSWTQTHCILAIESGHRQLVNIIGGGWKS